MKIEYHSGEFKTVKPRLREDRKDEKSQRKIFIKLMKGR